MLEETDVKKKLSPIICGVLCIALLSSCGKDPKLEAFKSDIDNFCNNLVRINEEINGIDPEKTNAPTELLAKLDELNGHFESFANYDFPEEFDYLEDLADEALEYMNTAVTSYHDAYSNGSYNEYTAEYAYQNYERAYKRIRIILDFIQGEEPEGDDISIQYTTE